MKKIISYIILSIALIPFYNCNKTKTTKIDATLVIKNINIIDVVNQKTLRNMTIIINDNKISDIKKSLDLKLDNNVKVIDGTNKYVIPGLWDMHFHAVNDTFYDWDLYNPDATDIEQRKTFAPLLVAFGITGTREMSGSKFSLNLKRQLHNKEIIGPHFVVGTPLVDGAIPLFPGGSTVSVANPNEAEELVKQFHEDGYDFIKTYSHLSNETYKAIHKSAKELNFEVSGEIPITVSLWEASDLGHKTVEHLTGLEIATSSKENELRSNYRYEVGNLTKETKQKDKIKTWNRSEWEGTLTKDLNKTKALYKHLENNNTWVVPTLVIQRAISYPNTPSVRTNPNYKYVTKYDTLVDYLIEEFDPERKLKPTYDNRFSSIKELHNAGVGILAGSDMQGGFPLLEELEIFVDAGLTPMEALTTATLNPAKYLDKEDEFGSIDIGKSADMVILNKNPLENISHLFKIDGVILKGYYLNRNLLDKYLAQTEKDARALENEFENSN
jgi:hypothetical protein